MNGAAAEERACAELRAQGLRLVQRNYRCRLGEIDLIMQDRDTLVFVEVRARKEGGRVSAGASVSPTKQRRWVAAARQYLGAHARYADGPMQFDLVTVDGAELRWLRNVIQLDG